MFPRKALSLVILSILNDNPDGLTKYFIFKEIKTKFGPVSAGTIYPRLDRLERKKYILEDGSVYKISERGKDLLTQNIPDVIDRSLKFMPMLYRSLMRPLSFKSRMHYLSHVPPFFGCSPNEHVWDDTILPEELVCTPDFTESIERLQKIKARLLEAKDQIQEQMNAELKAIDEKIYLIDEKIKQCQEDKESRIQIPIEDGDRKEE